MDHSIIKNYDMSGYHEYQLKQPDIMIDALWRQSTPINAPEGGVHHLVPETTVNIAISRVFNAQGSSSMEEAFLFGPINRPFSFKLLPGHELIAARVKPEWLPSMLGISADELLNTDANLADLSPILAAKLLSVFETCGSKTEMIYRLYDIIKAHSKNYVHRYNLPEYGTHAIELIRKSGGRLAQKHLAQTFDISDRQLRRTVQNLVGLSPKALSRNIRFLHTLEYADRTPIIDWSDCAVKFGYFDQAHLINEFKAMTKLTPAQLMRSRRDESVFSNPK